jgi:nitrogen fixation protein FixH
MKGQFTGRHATGILIGFFAIVIAVNVTMARLASSTFGGVLAENGYVASQDYNHWIKEAAAQDRLGWSATPRMANGRLVLDVTGVAFPTAAVTLEHPLGLVAERDLRMVAIAPDRLISAQHVPAGRWQVHVTIRSGGHEARFISEVRA